LLLKILLVLKKLKILRPKVTEIFTNLHKYPPRSQKVGIVTLPLRKKGLVKSDGIELEEEYAKNNLSMLSAKIFFGPN
jgi:hypothetical protein